MPELPDYCQYLPDGNRRPCYGLASLVLVRPSGETLSYTCREHLPAWASRIQGRYLVLERDEWEARGAGYRGPILGGWATGPMGSAKPALVLASDGLIARNSGAWGKQKLPFIDDFGPAAPGGDRTKDPPRLPRSLCWPRSKQG